MKIHICQDRTSPLTEALLVLDFEIQSHSGPYQVTFNDRLIGSSDINTLGTHYIIDRNVYTLLGANFYEHLAGKEITLIDATEDVKSYQGIQPIIQDLVDKKLKRGSVLVAIGGGITQDITCFIATTFMRGIDWVFVPTTLLAQADSCIGSKSSINFGAVKNLLGTFTPPGEVIICGKFLDTLEDRDIKSGIGEIIKLLLIDGQNPLPGSITRANLSEYVYKTLQIKKTFIERDEFDKNIRNVLNYGHCFGHGIESATNFAIPHGIAITMGMDVANQFALLEGMIDKEYYDAVQEVLYENYKEFSTVGINIDKVLAALTKDKKNTGNKINIVLPANGSIQKMGFENEPEFWNQARLALTQTAIATH